MSHVSDFDHRRLDATVYPDCVVEVHRISDIARGLRRVAVTKIWRTERVLGRGTFGEVHLQVHDKNPESKRAVKVIPTSGRMSSVECERELTALIEFTKPKYKDEAVFVAFLGWFQTENAIHLAMEYMPLGDLEINLQELEKSRDTQGHTDRHNGGVLSKDEVKDITVQILEGVKIMHAEGFAHRDLKPQNVLVAQREPRWWVKLGDFGLSKRRTEATVYHSRAGTESYMAPEMFYYIPGLNPESSEYTNAVDIWALGCITYRILTGKPPFPNLYSLKEYCSNPKLLVPPEEAENFVQRLLAPHPEERLTASTALEHPWLSTNAQTATIAMSQIGQISIHPNLVENTPEAVSNDTRPLSTTMDNSQSQYNYNTASHAGLRSNIKENTPVMALANNQQSIVDLKRMRGPIPGTLNVEQSNSLSLSKDPTTVVEEEQKPIVEEKQRQTVKEGQKLTLEGKQRPTGEKGGEPPRGKVVASASGDETVRLWDSATGAACHTLKGHSDLVRAVAFSPDGKLVASASYDKRVRLWDSATGAACHTLKGHSGSVLSVTFSPDGKLVASASADNTVRLWDSATGAACHTLEGHSDLVYTVAFSPDGKLVASASGDKTVRLWDSATGAACHTLKGHSSWVYAVEFSPDGKLVASASADGTVRLWQLAIGVVGNHPLVSS